MLVTVTGASGFIALHCLRALLTQGYRVRGTVRTADKERPVREALADVPGAADRLEFAVADLTADAGWVEALAGSTYVLHTASPVPARAPDHDDEVIVPARDGTLRVLRAASSAGVRRVVVTSSVAAVLSGHVRGRDRVFTEADWSDLQAPMPAYSRSKTLAERAAWAFVDAQPRERRIELVTVNPSYVLGPSLAHADNASNEIVRKLLHRELPAVPRLMLPTVDVRDVAAAHLLAMTVAEAAGERFIVSEGAYWFAELARPLRDAGYRVPTRVAPDWLVRAVGWFDPTVRLVVRELGREVHLASDKARRVLGWQTRPLAQTLADTAAAIAARPPRR